MTPQDRIEQYFAAINAAYLGDSPLPEYPSEPSWRIEQFLAAILSAATGDSPVVVCPDPAWRIEEFARAIYDAMTVAYPAWPCPTATNNIEAILCAIYKVVADGDETSGLSASWDIEQWLMGSYNAAKEGGGSLETVTGNAPIILADALAKRLVSLKQYGKCETSGGKTYCNNGEVKARVDDPAEIYVDGTPEVLTVVGKNLLNSATNVEGSYISATGVITADNSTPPKSQYTDLIPVVAGEKYTWSLISNRATSGNNRCHGYDANGDWAQQVAFDSSGAGGEAFTLTATIPSGVAFVRLSYGATDTDAQFEHGEAATAYQAYSAQTATVPDLFATNEVADEVDLISGVVTRKTEVTVSGGSITITARGTPVTENVTPQPMMLEEGANTVTVVAEVSPIELAAVYRKARS